MEKTMSTKKDFLNKITTAIQNQQFNQLIIEYYQQKPETLQLIDHDYLTSYWKKLLESLQLYHHCLENISNAPEKRSPFYIIAGVQCYASACKEYEANHPKLSLEWLQRGEFFHDYSCIDRLNQYDRETIKIAAENSEQSLDLQAIIERALHAARYHYSAGFGLLAETAYSIARYHEKKGSQDQDRWFMLAAVAINAALELFPHCQKILANATRQQRWHDTFSWLREDIQSLKELKVFYENILFKRSHIPSTCEQARTIGKNMGLSLLSNHSGE